MFESVGGDRVKKIRDFRKPIMICAAPSYSSQKRCRFYEGDIDRVFGTPRCKHLAYSFRDDICAHPSASKLIRPEGIDDAEK